MTSEQSNEFALTSGAVTLITSSMGGSEKMILKWGIEKVIKDLNTYFQRSKAPFLEMSLF